MRYNTIFIAVIAIVCIVILYVTAKQKDGFMNGYCNQYTDCTSCANASGCSWCPESKFCLNSTTLKSTDNSCNQMNTISSAFRCKAAEEDTVSPTLQSDISSGNVMYDFSLYKNRITDKIPPPNVYTSGEVKTSSADIMSDMNSIRTDLRNYQKELPGIISSAVENQIKPMVKGVLSDNYYIQGFEDIGDTKKRCDTYNSCSSCVKDVACGWDPRRMDCDIRGPNKTTYITQPSRCVLTPGTLSLMITQPN